MPHLSPKRAPLVNFVIAINAAPESATAQQALLFAEAVLKNKHTVSQLFFFGEGVRNLVLSAEAPLAKHWQQLILQHCLDAVACINALQTYRPQTTDQSLEFASVAGMAQLVAASASADRTVTFGVRENTL